MKEGAPAPTRNDHIDLWAGPEPREFSDRLAFSAYIALSSRRAYDKVSVGSEYGWTSSAAERSRK